MSAWVSDGRKPLSEDAKLPIEAVGVASLGAAEASALMEATSMGADMEGMETSMGTDMVRSWSRLSEKRAAGCWAIAVGGRGARGRSEWGDATVSAGATWVN